MWLADGLCATTFDSFDDDAAVLLSAQSRFFFGETNCDRSPFVNWRLCRKKNANLWCAVPNGNCQTYSPPLEALIRLSLCKCSVPSFHTEQHSGKRCPVKISRHRTFAAAMFLPSLRNTERYADWKRTVGAQRNDKRHTYLCFESCTVARVINSQIHQVYFLREMFALPAKDAVKLVLGSGCYGFHARWSQPWVEKFPENNWWRSLVRNRERNTSFGRIEIFAWPCSDGTMTKNLPLPVSGRAALANIAILSCLFAHSKTGQNVF